MASGSSPAASPFVPWFQATVEALAVPAYAFVSVTVIDAVVASAVKLGWALQLLGHESGTQSFAWIVNISGELAGIVCGLEKVTVVEPLTTAAVPASCVPVR